MISRQNVTSISALVFDIQKGEESAFEEFYSLFQRGFRFLLTRQLGWDDVDDHVHNCVVIVIEAVRRDGVREPERFLGFVSTIVRRYIAGEIRQKAADRSSVSVPGTWDYFAGSGENAEQQLVRKRQMETARLVLGSLPERDREVLRRFYIKEQSMEHICAEMGLSGTQFRNLKSRAKQRFSTKCQESGTLRMPTATAYGDPSASQHAA